jgi:hypothetical protein
MLEPRGAQHRRIAGGADQAIRPSTTAGGCSKLCVVTVVLWMRAELAEPAGASCRATKARPRLADHRSTDRTLPTGPRQSRDSSALFDDHVGSGATRPRGPGREPDSSSRQAPAVGADRDVAEACLAILTGSRNHTIPANRRPIWVLAVMTHDRSRASLEVVLDRLISRLCRDPECTPRCPVRTPTRTPPATA